MRLTPQTQVQRLAHMIRDIAGEIEEEAGTVTADTLRAAADKLDEAQALLESYRTGLSDGQLMDAMMLGVEAELWLTRHYQRGGSFEDVPQIFGKWWA
jgi:hypothetical protein